jgi:hypothetical protein
MAYDWNALLNSDGFWLALASIYDRMEDPDGIKMPTTPQERALLEWKEALARYDPARHFSSDVAFQNISQLQGQTPQMSFMSPHLKGQTPLMGMQMPKIDFSNLPSYWTQPVGPDGKAPLIGNRQGGTPFTGGGAPPTSTRDDAFGNIIGGGGSGREAAENMPHKHNELYRDMVPIDGVGGGGALINAAGRNNTLERLAGMQGAPLNWQGVRTALSQFGRGPVMSVINFMRAHPTATAAVIGMTLGPEAGVIARTILQAAGPPPQGGTGNGAIPGSIAGSGSGQGALP